MTKQIKFDLYEQHLEEHKKRLDARSVFLEREQEAKASHSELLSEYQITITASVEGGTDATAKLDALDAKIAESARLYERRKRETKAAYAVNRSAISRVDIINAYRSDYLPKVQASFIPDFKARIKQARDLLLSAAMDLQAAEEDYRLYVDDIKGVAKAAHESGETPALMSLNRPFDSLSMRAEMRQIVDVMNKALEEGELPEGVTYIEGGK